MRINLLPPDERPLKQSTVRWEFLAAALGLCLLALTVGLYLNEQAKVSQLLFQLEQWTKYEQVLQRQAQAVTELRGEINRLQSQRSSLEKLLADGGQVQCVDNVLALVEGEVWAEVVSWDRDRVRLAGYAANMTELTIYVNDLEAAGFKVAVISTNPEGAGSFTTFVLDVEGGE